jgi:hypothetical protein
MCLGRIFLQLPLVVMLLLTSIPSGAQSDRKKNTIIDFEDELIEGEVKKPELMYLMQKKQFNFKRLIKLRKNFLPEMRRTAEDVKAKGRGN